jgi:hypothetical protein
MPNRTICSGLPNSARLPLTEWGSCARLPNRDPVSCSACRIGPSICRIGSVTTAEQDYAAALAATRAAQAWLANPGSPGTCPPAPGTAAFTLQLRDARDIRRSPISATPLGEATYASGLDPREALVLHRVGGQTDRRTDRQAGPWTPERRSCCTRLADGQRQTDRQTDRTPQTSERCSSFTSLAGPLGKSSSDPWPTNPTTQCIQKQSELDKDSQSTSPGKRLP